MPCWTVGRLEIARSMLFCQLTKASLFLETNFLRTLCNRSLTLKCLQLFSFGRCFVLWGIANMQFWITIFAFLLNDGFGCTGQALQDYAGVVLSNSIVTEQLEIHLYVPSLYFLNSIQLEDTIVARNFFSTCCHDV